MKGVLTLLEEHHTGGHWREDRIVERVVMEAKDQLPLTIRYVVEHHDNLALDAKADREALIRDLVEALC